MRIRHKPWAKPELEACPFYISEPKLNRGHWNTIFPGEKKPLRLELGCGKGGFISQEAPANPDYHYIAMDIKNEMLVLAKRKLEAAYAEQQLPLDNVRIFICNLMQFSEYFSPEDRVERIYINFCNPWPKGKHKKRRLTHPRQLQQYRTVLDGEIWFKPMMMNCLKNPSSIFRNVALTLCSRPPIYIKNRIFKVSAPNTRQCLKRWERPLNF